jgi:hypothetical protein
LPSRRLFLRALILETGLVSERLRVREIDDDEGRRLVQIIRWGSGSVVTWRREIKKIAKSKPVEHDLPFSTWSLVKMAEFLVAEGVVEDISH